MLRKILMGLVICFALPSTNAFAVDWPQKTVRIIVPYAAGSTPDLIARLIFERVEKTTSKTMLIINKPGGAGMIGADMVAKSDPDGYTLLIAPAGPLATNTLLYKKMTYDPIKDLTPVALVAETPSVLVASTAVAALNTPELVKAMSDPKNKYSYGSPGYGTVSHLSMAYLVSLSRGDVIHAPYSGSPQVAMNLISNDVQLAVLTPQAVAQFVNAGRIKALGIVGPQRSSALPNVPTLKEQGIDFDPVGWFGIATRAGTPEAIVDSIYAAISEAMKDPELERSYKAQGLEVVDRGPKEFAAYVHKELGQWQPVITQNKISLD